MIRGTDKRFDAVNKKYRNAFGEDIPLMMVPDGETIEGLLEKIEKSIRAGKDLLPEFYNWNNEDLY